MPAVIHPTPNFPRQDEFHPHFPYRGSSTRRHLNRGGGIDGRPLHLKDAFRCGCQCIVRLGVVHVGTSALWTYTDKWQKLPRYCARLFVFEGATHDGATYDLPAPTVLRTFKQPNSASCGGPPFYGTAYYDENSELVCEDYLDYAPYYWSICDGAAAWGGVEIISSFWTPDSTERQDIFLKMLCGSKYWPEPDVEHTLLLYLVARRSASETEADSWLMGSGTIVL